MRRTNRLTVSGLMIALLAVCAQIHLPLPMVPVNLALLAVHLCAVLLPPGQAMMTVGAYVLMGALGLPVFAGLRGGLAALLDRSGGFLLGYILSAGISSGMLRRGHGRGKTVLALAAGTLACYMAGTAWFMAVTGMGLWSSLMWCVAPFIPGDALKIILAAGITPRLKKSLAGGR